MYLFYTLECLIFGPNSLLFRIKNADNLVNIYRVLNRFFSETEIKTQLYVYFRCISKFSNRL